jgi:hypothetical protein
MIVILAAFSLFHLVAGVAGLGLAMRLLAPEEAAHWRSKRPLLAARILCWVYPVLALVCVSLAWRRYEAAEALALPLILAPFVWLVVMGVVFAIVDFAEDGVLGNARTRD